MPGKSNLTHLILDRGFHSVQSDKRGTEMSPDMNFPAPPLPVALGL